MLGLCSMQTLQTQLGDRAGYSTSRRQMVSRCICGKNNDGNWEGRKEGKLRAKAKGEQEEERLSVLL